MIAHRRACGVARAAILVTVLLAAAGPAAAETVLPGFDLFSVLPTEQSRYDFASSPIPADFFAPGSLPFDGVIQLQGATGGADTIVQRLGGMILGGPPGGDTVPIEIVALNLVSCQPITVHSGSGPDTLWDLHVDLGGASTGNMNVQRTHANGGTFSSSFFVQPRFTFTRVGPPATTTPFVQPTSAGGTGDWTFAPPPGVLPSPNNFYPGGDPLNPLVLESVVYSGGPLSLELRLTQVPEPATVGLLALGGIALGGWGRARRKR